MIAAPGVEMDLRAIGQSQEVFRGCANCCDEIAKRLSEAIAEVNDEDQVNR